MNGQPAPFEKEFISKTDQQGLAPYLGSGRRRDDTVIGGRCQRMPPPANAAANPVGLRYLKPAKKKKEKTNNRKKNE